jgi:GxxExxY protein
MMDYKHSELTEQIIKAFYKVYNTLGYGFLEKVYERAMLIELRKMGLSARNQVPVDVWYEGQKVGFYLADIVVENLIIAELKSGESLTEGHEAQLTNYLRGTDKEVGLLLGFCKSPMVKRRAFHNEYKTSLTGNHE